MAIGKELFEHDLYKSRKEVQMETIGMAMVPCPILGHEALVEKNGRVHCLYFDDGCCEHAKIHGRIYQGLWTRFLRWLRPLPPVGCMMLEGE